MLTAPVTRKLGETEESFARRIRIKRSDSDRFRWRGIKDLMDPVLALTAEFKFIENGCLLLLFHADIECKGVSLSD